MFPCCIYLIISGIVSIKKMNIIDKLFQNSPKCRSLLKYYQCELFVVFTSFYPMRNFDYPLFYALVENWQNFVFKH